MDTATAMKIRGEEKHDIALLKGEINRLSAVSRDLKQRRAALVEKATNDKKELAKDIEKLTQRKLDINSFRNTVSKQLFEIETRLRQLVIEDTFFEREIECAKSIVDQFRRTFPNVQTTQYIAEAESMVTVAELYIKERLKVCNEFIKKRLDPTQRQASSLDATNLIAAARNLYAESCKIADDIDDATLKAMGLILECYGILYDRYLLLVKALEKTQPIRGRNRVFE